jgi:hypothetical protein
VTSPKHFHIPLFWGSPRPIRKAFPAYQYVCANVTEHLVFAETDSVPVRSYSTPRASVSSPRCHVTSATESGECRVHTSSGVNAAEAIGLHPRCAFAGEHHVSDMLVVAEYRVVEPFLHTSMIGEFV